MNMKTSIKSVSYVYGNTPQRPATWGCITYKCGKQRVINFSKGERAPATVGKFILNAEYKAVKVMKQTGDTVITWGC